MLHHIIVKWNDQVTDKSTMAAKVAELYAPASDIPGVHGVTLKPNVIDRPNRYDLMIVLDLEPEALTAWDASDLHKQWKANFGALIAQKAIFDCD